MGGLVGFFLLLILTVLILSTIAFGIAIVWETVNINLERKSIRRTLDPAKIDRWNRKGWIGRVSDRDEPLDRDLDG